MTSKLIVTDGKIYAICDYCKSLIRLNKPIIGSLHACLPPEEREKLDLNLRRAEAEQARQAMAVQQQSIAKAGK